MKLFSIKNLQFLQCGPIDLQLKSAEMIGLSGASGSGKSRLLRALADMDEHQGEVQLDNIRQQDISAHLWRRKVALLPAETSWWFDTVGLHFGELSEQHCQLLGFTEPVANWSISRLSSGEKQRLGLLRILQKQPDVILLDEPTANLDKKNSILFENFLIDYLQKNNACAIWVSHDTEQLQRLCQRRYIIKDGNISHVD